MYPSIWWSSYQIDWSPGLGSGLTSTLARAGRHTLRPSLSVRTGITWIFLICLDLAWFYSSLIGPYIRGFRRLLVPALALMRHSATSGRASSADGMILNPSRTRIMSPVMAGTRKLIALVCFKLEIEAHSISGEPENNRMWRWGGVWLGKMFNSLYSDCELRFSRLQHCRSYFRLCSLMPGKTFSITTTINKTPFTKQVWQPGTVIKRLLTFCRVFFFFCGAWDAEYNLSYHTKR